LLQAESIVDHLAFALIPYIAHTAPPTERSSEPAGRDTSNSAKCGRQ
jgi:hypothetical protein